MGVDLPGPGGRLAGDPWRRSAVIARFPQRMGEVPFGHGRFGRSAAGRSAQRWPPSTFRSWPGGRVRVSLPRGHAFRRPGDVIWPGSPVPIAGLGDCYRRGGRRRVQAPGGDASGCPGPAGRILLPGLTRAVSGSGVRRPRASHASGLVSLVCRADSADKPARVRHSGEYTRRSSQVNLADTETGDTSRIRPASPSAPRAARTAATALRSAWRRPGYLAGQPCGQRARDAQGTAHGQARSGSGHLGRSGYGIGQGGPVPEGPGRARPPGGMQRGGGEQPGARRGAVCQRGVTLPSRGPVTE